MDVLPPLPYFPRPSHRVSPPRCSSSRYNFITSSSRTRSLTTPHLSFPTFPIAPPSPYPPSTQRFRGRTTPRTPDLSSPGGGGGAELLAPMDQLDHLLLFLPEPLVPTMLEQLARIDASSRRLQGVFGQRGEEARGLGRKRLAAATQSLDDPFIHPPSTRSFGSGNKTSPDLALTPPTPIKSTQTSHPLPARPPTPLSAHARPFLPPPKPPTPTLKALFLALRALDARLDVVDPSPSDTDPATDDRSHHPSKEAARLNEPDAHQLWADLAKLDKWAHGPKWKNWRRERARFVARLSGMSGVEEPVGSAAGRGSGKGRARRARKSDESDSTTIIVLNLDEHSPPRHRGPTRPCTAKNELEIERGTPVLSPSLSMSPSTTETGGGASVPATPEASIALALALEGSTGTVQHHHQQQQRRQRKWELGMGMTALDADGLADGRV